LPKALARGAQLTRSTAQICSYKPAKAEYRVPDLVDVAQLHRLEAGPHLLDGPVRFQAPRRRRGSRDSQQLRSRIESAWKLDIQSASSPTGVTMLSSRFASSRMSWSRRSPGHAHRQVGLMADRHRRPLPVQAGGAEPRRKALRRQGALGVVEGGEPAEGDVPGGSGDAPTRTPPAPPRVGDQDVRHLVGQGAAGLVGWCPSE
jgi:hypothetical protein